LLRRVVRALAHSLVKAALPVRVGTSGEQADEGDGDEGAMHDAMDVTQEIITVKQQ
jgi:hypothetical protein